jgi:hypothetical protein
MIYGNTAASTGPSQSFTLAHLLEAKRRVDALGPPIGAVKIIQSTNAVLKQQAKVYPKRKAKNAAHLRRMNNKWRKRYGFTYKPTIFEMNLGATGLGQGKVFVVHPALMPRLRDAFPTPCEGGK